MKLRFLLLSIVLFSVSSKSFAGQFVLLNEQDIQAVKESIADGSASAVVKDEYKRLLNG